MRRSHPVRRVLISALVPVLMLGVAACGSDKPSTSKATEGAAASGTGADPGDEVKPEVFAKSIVEGMASSSTSHIEMQMKLSGLEVNASGEVDNSASPPEMAMSISMPMFGEKPIDMRLVDGKIYMNLGTMSGDNYYVIDVEDTESQLGDLSKLTDSYDPKKLAATFTEGASKIVYVGPEQVDSQSLEHYTVTMDTAKLSTLQDLGSSVTSTLPKTLEYDMWLDSQSRLAKVSIDLGKDLGTVDLAMSKWGEPVTIEAPPADQVTEMPKTGGLGLDA